jgi:hypothetical protein
LLATALALCAIAAMRGVVRAQSGTHGDGHGAGHPVYKGWTTPQGGSCCNDSDCRPTRAFVDELGRWRAFDGRKWVVVPPDALLRIPSPDGRSHLCMSQGAELPRCFVPGEPRS